MQATFCLHTILHSEQTDRAQTDRALMTFEQLMDEFSFIAWHCSFFFLGGYSLLLLVNTGSNILQLHGRNVFAMFVLGKDQ